MKGWINYYGHFYKSELQRLLNYLNLILKSWARQKFKKLRGRKVRASNWLGRVTKTVPNLFAHWQLGVRP
ncbi:group II intron maturase-specific domain-containing protein [Pontibacter silvestris]|uniref:Group II intron maturase-specific domain-containing protein n=1 Tax=Pontibacter silvestris TaxID=2305183 RepID=A0ABW4X3U8_9BACT